MDIAVTYATIITTPTVKVVMMARKKQNTVWAIIGVIGPSGSNWRLSRSMAKSSAGWILELFRIRASFKAFPG